MLRVVHFEIHADDTSRAAKFYENIFGWKLEKWGVASDEYYLITTGSDKEPGINGGLMKRKGEGPKFAQVVNSYVCTVKVDNVDSYIKKVQDNKGNIVLAKMPIPGIGYFAYCTDNNLFNNFKFKILLNNKKIRLN